MSRRISACMVLVCGALLLNARMARSTASAVPVVRANDNRKAAGRIDRDTLRLRLVVQMADWYAEADTGPVLRVAAFSEEGEVPQIPAPLIRVREGTMISATVRNALTDSAITLLGLNAHPTPQDSVILKPGESRTLVFAAGAPGTYLYRARIGLPSDAVERDQTGGAFIVDPKAGSPPDRIFVMNIWGELLDSTRYGNALTMNGRSWPHTERITTTVGDTLHWRVINASGRPHPMHLHGAHFQVNSKGGAFSDTTYTRAQQRLAVTEEMDPQQTMRIAWSASRPGRWVFHCHILFHVAPPDARLNPAAHGEHDVGSIDPGKHMAGLVIGIEARLPAGARDANRTAPRRLDLWVQEGKPRGRAPRAMGFVLQRDRHAPAPDSVELPGSLLVLTRGQPTDITVHNRLSQATAVHWHGLELESYSDGVAGWGGVGARRAPAVTPNGQFVARLSMPRAGTYIYHTHLNDLEQLSSGLYGPIVVMEPGQTFDPRTDHVHTVGWDLGNDLHLLVNGDSVSSPPIEMRVGATHRFRFINIGAADLAEFSLRQDSTIMQWRVLAKDGATVQPAQRVLRPAQVTIDVGETYDFEFTPTRAGEYILSTPTGPTGATWHRKLIVR